MLFKTAIAALTAMAALVLAPAAHALTTLSGVTWTGTATGITVTATVSDAATLGACGGWGYKLGFAPAGATYSYFVTQDGATGDIIRTDTEGIIGHATVSSGGQLLTIDLPTAVIGRPTDLAWQLDSYNLGDGVTAPCEALWYTFRSQGGQALEHRSRS